MVYVLFADGFEEIEALTPVDILRRGGVDVCTVSVTENAEVTGAHGIKITADKTAQALSLAQARQDMEMLVFPGGMPGTSNLDSCALTEQLIAVAADAYAYIGAICAAPMILGKRNLLYGHRATCYPSFEQHLREAEYVDEPLVFDGSFITAKAMGAAVPFSLKLLEVLTSAEKAEAVRASIFA